ncbi:DUF6616 family protein [Methylobacterium sp. WSM2598]|uniref:DUF6616 family protein n=1 Tax=Methylobacterium sp. WSM2598 TaxID=398261 RepID=UPI0003730CB9|nr:DUF6616 family protein [Methylobacterium sp. WSM2598]
MSHYLIELYTAKPAWLALSQDEREHFLSAIDSAMPLLSKAGVEPMTFGRVDPSQRHPASHGFYAVWRCRDEAALEALVSGIAQSGWHDYFDTINACGEGVGLIDHLSQLGDLA